MNAPARILEGPKRPRGQRAVQPLMPSLERRRLQCHIAMLVGDVLALVAGFWAGGFLYQGNIGVASSLLFVQFLA